MSGLEGGVTMSNTFERIYAIARQVPYGRVTTYGQIALLVGNPRLSRVVGYAMHSAPDDIPCHRVDNRRGELSDAFHPLGKQTQRQLLEGEGVEFMPNGSVNLRQFMWFGPQE